MYVESMLQNKPSKEMILDVYWKTENIEFRLCV